MQDLPNLAIADQVRNDKNVNCHTILDAVSQDFVRQDLFTPPQPLPVQGGRLFRNELFNYSTLQLFNSPQKHCDCGAWHLSRPQ